jgi:hypothetical protein
MHARRHHPNIQRAAHPDQRFPRRAPIASRTDQFDKEGYEGSEGTSTDGATV